MIATVTPLYDRLLVRVIKAGEKTQGGIIVPQMVAENTPFLTAEVLAAGHGRANFSGQIVPLKVKDGDVVVFVRTGGTRDDQIMWPLPDGTEAMIIRESHVALVLSDLPKSTGVLDRDGKEVVTPALVGADEKGLAS